MYKIFKQEGNAYLDDVKLKKSLRIRHDAAFEKDYSTDVFKTKIEKGDMVGYIPQLLHGDGYDYSKKAMAISDGYLYTPYVTGTSSYSNRYSLYKYDIMTGERNEVKSGYVNIDRRYTWITEAFENDGVIWNQGDYIYHIDKQDNVKQLDKIPSYRYIDKAVTNDEYLVFCASSESNYSSITVIHKNDSSKNFTISYPSAYSYAAALFRYKGEIYADFMNDKTQRKIYRLDFESKSFVETDLDLARNYTSVIDSLQAYVVDDKIYIATGGLVETIDANNNLFELKLKGSSSPFQASIYNTKKTTTYYCEKSGVII